MSELDQIDLIIPVFNPVWVFFRFLGDIAFGTLAFVYWWNRHVIQLYTLSPQQMNRGLSDRNLENANLSLTN